MAKKADSRPANLDELIIKELDLAYNKAESYFIPGKENEIPQEISSNLSQDFIDALDGIAKLCEKASTGYLNVITGLAIKAVYGDTVDVRYHQVQIQNQTDKPAGFNFRGVSEHIIFHWMENHEFHGAKSGWQTRTFERPKPYFLNYEENIGAIKVPFLSTYDQIETHNQNAKLGLAFLLLRRIELRERTKITLAIPRLQDILQITNLFKSHFFYSYKDSKGASRLPVIALHAIYKVLMQELVRYNGKILKDLESHSAADSQTGSIGDIEIANKDGSIFEAVEVKHMIPISKELVDIAKQKIRGCQADRYYILTTHNMHDPSDEVITEVENVKRLLGCQMIVNGVIPSIKYYLRLLTNPGAVLPNYVQELATDKAISFEHRDVWNKIATGSI